ncbi:MAG: DNA-processing protein DprA [Pseudomonadales bacterium]|nr:DNA-processing protein DprA [Pseudomonadales bacterium]
MTNQEDLLDWLCLFHSAGLPATNLRALLDRFGSASAILDADRNQLSAIGISPVAQRAIRSCRLSSSPARQRAQQDLHWQESQPDHAIVTLADKAYPAMLRSTVDPPPVLYVKGDPQAMSHPQLALVGSRACSRYGEEVAMRLAAELGRAGFCICSGLAAGIDAAAHRAALQSGAHTVAVLGNGIDTVYPPGNAKLAGKVRAQGALVSEFARDQGPRRAYFPQRNRLISGLSLGVIVVEATLRSGSLITARFALEQNREVFAVPGSVNNPGSRGCHRLLREGAKLVESAEDVLSEIVALAQGQLQWLQSGTAADGQSPAALDRQRENTLDATEKSILSVLEDEPASLDCLLRHTQSPTQVLTEKLLQLELKGLIECVTGGYRRC